LISFCPTVVTAHDVSYLVSDDFYPYKTGRVRRGYYSASLRKADRIIVSSSFSAREIARLRPGLAPKIRTVHLGVGVEFHPDEQGSETVKAELNLPSRFLLHVGDLHTRRKPELLVRVSDKLGIPLVLVGRKLRGCGQLPEPVRNLTALPLNQLAAVYSAALVLLSVSEYEGFGLPLLEAMASGIPVVAAKRSCYPEICGDAAVLVEPQLDAVCEGVLHAISCRHELGERGLRRAAEFSWEKTAAETLKVYREAAGE
jgi:glycosyltransferase involved in cell wall biosynthesis